MKIKEKPTCINCGAPLTGIKCEYCGTEYEPDERNNVSIKTKSIDNFIVELEIKGENHRFYIAETQFYDDCDTYTDCKGVMHREILSTKRKITLIEI